MSIPAPPAQVSPPVSSGMSGSGHQLVYVAASTAQTPSYFAPVPVAANLLGGTVGVAYSETISGQGGVTPYTFALTAGALPTSMTLNTATGVISGTPTVAGTYSFTISVTDVNGAVGSQAFTIIIAALSVTAVNVCWAN